MIISRNSANIDKEVFLDPGVVAVLQDKAVAKKAFKDASVELSALVEHYDFFSI